MDVLARGRGGGLLMKTVPTEAKSIISSLTLILCLANPQGSIVDLDRCIHSTDTVHICCCQYLIKKLTR
jgi:hypothetical protein